MSAVLNFDASGVKPIGINEPVPEGWYTVMMVESESKPTNAGDGSYLACEYEILEPADFKGRRVFDNLNLGNKNPTAVEIAYRKLSAICHAVGVIQVQDSSQLHNRPLLVKIGLRPATTAEQSQDGKAHDASNEVKGYKAVDADGNNQASAAPAPAAFPAPAPAAAAAEAKPATPAFGAPPATGAGAPPAGGATPPWMKK